MQNGFDRATPIVDLGANSRPLAWKRETRQWVLWPVHAYKILVPAARNSALNIFQRAALDLCRAGVRDPEKIANRLALPADLVKFLVDQLSGMDLLDEDAGPTERARRILAEEDEQPESEDVGYALVDGIDRRLWPRLHLGSLPMIDAEIDEERGSARLRRGSPGRPRIDVARFIWPIEADRVATAPSAREIVKAARLHKRRTQAFAKEWPNADPIKLDANVIAKRGVRLVSTVAEPVFVAACIFVPDDARHRSWLVTDPCGLGVSNVLRDAITRLAKADRGGIRKIIEKLTGDAWHVDEGELARYLAEAGRAAAARIAHRLGAAADLLPADAVRRLADADERLQSAQDSAFGNTKELESFYGDIYAALENVFGWLLALSPDPSMLAAFEPDPEINAGLLQRIADVLGFDTSESTLALFRVSRAVVKGALCDGNKDLRGRLAACLMATRFDRGHPLSALAATCPGAMDLLARLRDLRNAGQHDTGSIPRMEEACADRERLFDLLRALVGSGPADLASETGANLSWGSDLLLRIRAQAEKIVETDYPDIDARLDLRTRLIEMHAAAILLRLLDRSEETAPDSLRTRLRDFVVAAAIIAEALLAEIERAAPSRATNVSELGEDRVQNAERIVAIASSLGFTLDAVGRLPEALTHARADRVRRAVSGRAETLSARLIALLLAAAGEPDHPLREVARASPAFLLHLGRIVEVRGHADSVHIDTTEAAELESTVAKEVQAVLGALYEVTGS